MTLIAISVLAVSCLILGIELTTVLIGLMYSLYFGGEHPILFLLLIIGVIAGLLTPKK